MPSANPTRVHYGRAKRTGVRRRPPGQNTVKAGVGGSGAYAGPGAFELLLATAYVANMSEAFEEATKAFGRIFLTVDGADIDNYAFKLFYRATVVLLIASALLATSKQAFGDPISCQVQLGSGVKDDVLNSFCWMYSSFNIPEAFTGTCAKRGQDPTILYNSYYQWVPIFLLLKVAAFCTPRVLWLMFEGGLMKWLSKGTKDKVVDSPKEKQALLLDAFSKYLLRSQDRIYALKYFICEQANSLVLLLSWWTTHRFLKGQFLDYGLQVVSYYGTLPEEEREFFRENPMCEV